jgi:hypothetical protein
MKLYFLAIHFEMRLWKGILANMLGRVIVVFLINKVGRRKMCMARNVRARIAL